MPPCRYAISSTQCAQPTRQRISSGKILEPVCDGFYLVWIKPRDIVNKCSYFEGVLLVGSRVMEDEFQPFGGSEFRSKMIFDLISDDRRQRIK
jgi:hypothetical protein